MEIYFKDKKIAKIFNSKKELIKKYGNNIGKKIMQRLDDMKAAKNLEELMTLPGNHHPLRGDREGQFACSVGQPYRLIYEVANNPIPTDEKGNLIYKEVTMIIIIEIIDYH